MGQNNGRKVSGLQARAPNKRAIDALRGENLRRRSSGPPNRHREYGSRFASRAELRPPAPRRMRACDLSDLVQGRRAVAANAQTGS